MKTLAKLTVLLFITITLNSCNMGIAGNGKVTTENRKINGTFNKIKVGNGLNIYLRQSENTSVRVEADENLQQLIKTELNGDVLKVYTQENIGSASAKDIYISTPIVNEVKVSSGSNLVTENTLKTSNFEVSSSSGASATLSIETTNIIASSSSGASLTLKGKTTGLEAKSSSGASLDAASLLCNDANAKASSGANIAVNASNKLNARASSGATISYQGNPAVLTEKSSSGGNVSQN